VCNGAGIGDDNDNDNSDGNGGGIGNDTVSTFEDGIRLGQVTLGQRQSHRIPFFQLP